MYDIYYEIQDPHLLKILQVWIKKHSIHEKKDNLSHPLRILFIEVDGLKKMDKITNLLETYVDKKPYEIVFIGSNERVIFDLFLYKPLYFIRKQLLKEDLQSLQNMINMQLQGEAFIVVKSGNALVRIDQRKIQYIESFGHYLTIYTPYGSYRIRDKMTTFLDTLDKDCFIQTHKSYAVNMKHVERLESDCVRLQSINKSIAIGKSFKQVVIERFYQNSKKKKE